MRYKIGNIIFLSIISIIILNMYYILSISVMSIYNYINIQESKFNFNNIEINFKKQKDNWYPMMNTFNSNDFSNYIKKDVDLTILYTFGNFDFGSSVIFNPDNELFSSFYGCYIVGYNEKEKEYYGFDDNDKIILNEIIKLPEYDFKYLVAGPMGLNKIDFNLNFKLKSIYYSDESVYIDFESLTNSMFHNYKKFNQNYLQYGMPYIKRERSDFFTVKLFSRFKIEKYGDNITLIYYVFSPSEHIVKNWNF